MKSRSSRLLITMLAVVLVVPLLTAATGGRSDAARAEHQRIIDFWTPERVAQAVPRDFVFDPGTGRFLPSAKPEGSPGGKPGGGGGGDGGGGDGGGDGGVTVVTGDPWTADTAVAGSVGKVLFSMGDSYYVCSATVVDDGSATVNGSALILTAAHCAYDEVARTFAGNWMFIPDYDHAPASLDRQGDFCADTRYGCWSAQAITVHTGYATAGAFNDQAVLHDFAVVRVGPGGKSGSAELDSIVTEQGISFTALDTDGTASGSAFGYPAAKKWKGDDLIYCAGPIDGDPYNTDLTYRMNGCKLTGGSSGGGWFAGSYDGGAGGTLISVNSYGYSGVTAMHGPFFNADTAAVYNAAKSGGNKTVPNP